MNDSKDWKIRGEVMIGIALGLIYKNLSTMAPSGLVFGLFSAYNNKGE